MSTDSGPIRPRNGNFGLSYCEWLIGAEHHALVVTPHTDIVWGREFLEALRLSMRNSERDLEVVRAFERAQTRPHVFVFRGASTDGLASIGLAEDLSPAERKELVELLFVSHMAVMRSILRAGAQLFVYTDWDQSLLDLFRHAMSKIGDACEAKHDTADLTRTRIKVIRMDKWIVTRLNLYCAQSFEAVVGQLLPTSMPLFASREQRVAKLIEGIPAREFELNMGEHP